MSQINTSSHRRNYNQPRTTLLATFWCVGVLFLSPQANSHVVDVHGFLSQGYLKSTGNNFLAETKRGTWEFTEIGINFGTYVTDELHIGIQLFSRDLGEMGNLKLELDWAFGDYALTDYLGVRVGRIKTPYGLYGETQDVDLVRTTVFLPQSVYYLALRDILISFNGVSFYGNIDLSRFGSIDYQIFGGAVIGEPGTGPEGSTARFFNNRSREPLRHYDMAAFKVTHAVDRWTAGGMLHYNTALDGLVLRATILHHRADVLADLTSAFYEQITQLGIGQAGFSKKLKLSTDDTIFYVTSIEYTWDSLILAAEYSQYRGTFRSSQPELIEHTRLNQQKGYIQLGYNLNDWSAFAASYGFINDPEDPYGLKNAENGRMHYESFQKSITLSARFDLSDYWIIKMEGHLIDGTMLVYELDNRKHPDLERYWTLLAAKTTLAF